ncbi:hypothetical protein A2209_03340 [Candidatus Roizmanbacteria bacterium RIFOXYA1_FULL_41_12]|uniref:Uncharacterized protein n=1 Tax=Candidatus Roizmanbacteria bacterium RIFOXYA1_FULL_41_12 TaxID=1802082 RepID=A0A1F7K9P6_9BACT|nr:MAG: hypothetical protein A2209_03340 [Candidatus Roizmanbacteria bacterium RIFOXYA1_FULL_41_12]
MDNYCLLRPAKTEETTPAAQIGLLSSFLNIGKRSLLDLLMLKSAKYLSFEIVSINQKTRFYFHAPSSLKNYFISQVLAQYPKTLINEEKEDPLFRVVKDKKTSISVLNLSQPYCYPIKTYKNFVELPPLNAVLGFLSKLKEGEAAAVQIILKVPFSQEKSQHKIRGQMKSVDSQGQEQVNPYNKLIQEKLASSLLQAQIRLVFSGPETQASRDRLQELSGAFGVYTMSEGNSFVPRSRSGLFKKAFFKKIVEREFSSWQPTLTLNLDELASLWHLPDKKFEKIKSIYWGRQLLSEAPDNLPIASLHSNPDQTAAVCKGKKEVNFFGTTEWRNREEIFGISREDRSKHVYIIGKTGAGKSTMIANMAINDIRNGEGVAVIDPHGDLSEMILEYIPKRRVADVVYLDPTLSDDRAFSLNMFDKDSASHQDVIASGIVSVFYKLYGDSWGPRLEYILRNTIITLLHYGNGTFADILRILADKKFRDKIVDAIKDKDKVMYDFWRYEYDKMTDRLRVESISSIQNKVGQFVSSLRVRRILDSHKSTFSLEEIMDQKKILIINLSQGKLGEDTTALLGAMFITKMQLTAMRRVNMKPEERTDFYLYVDEFQNFATTSFIKILSEARKYKLNLTLANQYVGQVEEDIQKAIFGNVGTLITFVIGSSDAALFEKEFGGKFTADDLVALGKYQILLKMAINGLTSEPFFARTLPLPSVINHNKDKIIKLSLDKYYRQAS